MNAFPRRVSLDEFLKWEERQELKYEYDGFAARAMTGGTSAHALIQANLIGLLYMQLRDSPCRVYGSELKVKTATSIRYPDALVLCSPIAPDETTTSDPVIVFEVLSKSSAVFDLGAKSVEYRTLPSLRRYVVLHQRLAAAQTFHLNAAGEWNYDSVAAAGVLDLPEIGCEIPLVRLYAGVEFPA